jgi:transcription initiation factor TFIIE subunit alpha
MRLSNTTIEEVITKVAGHDVIPLVMALKNKKNVSEFKLADAIKQEVNITRNMLYRLYNANLVSFMRKKDKKKGWYIYYWTLDLKRIRYLLFELKKKRLKQLKERLEREQEGQFFICPNNCIRLDFVVQ